MQQADNDEIVYALESVISFERLVYRVTERSDAGDIVLTFHHPEVCLHGAIKQKLSRVFDVLLRPVGATREDMEDCARHPALLVVWNQRIHELSERSREYRLAILDAVYRRGDIVQLALVRTLRSLRNECNGLLDWNDSLSRDLGKLYEANCEFRNGSGVGSAKRRRSNNDAFQ